MSWLSQALHGIHLDSHTLGNLAKNVSPFLAFTPLGLPGAAALGALGEAGRGHANLGDMARAGLSNAAIGGGLRAGAGLLRGALSSGAPGAAAQNVAQSGAPASVPNMASSAAAGPTPEISIGGATTPGPQAAALPSVGTPPPPSFLSRVMGDVGDAADFAEHHPNTVAMGLQGLGGIATAGARNRLANTQADALDYDLNARKRRDSYLAQYLAQYGAPRPVAPNPYMGR